MKYYYDLVVNFNDNFMHCYEWNSDDNVERLLKVSVIRVSDVSLFIKNVCRVNLNDGVYAVSDGVNSIGIDVIDGKNVYISSFMFDDDSYICKIASSLDLNDIIVEVVDSRCVDSSLRCDSFIKKVLLNIIYSDKEDLIKYIYLDVTGRLDDIDKCKSFLKNDIYNNFNNKYYELYGVIFNK